jgi:putative oxidoreductase
VARLLLGLIFLFFGLNFFFHFLNGIPPDPASKAGLFLGGLFGSGYFFVFLKSLEVVYGLLLFLGRLTPLVLILLFPISINILLFHVFLSPAPESLVIAAVIFLLNLYLAWVNRAVYKPLFKLGNNPSSLTVVAN